jgi:phosphopantetheine adenylyltransferase
MTLSEKEKLLLLPLLNFFSKSENFEVLQRYRNKKSNVSVSLLDWFTVNYAKKYGVRYQIIKNGRKKNVLVEQSYMSALSAHTKEYFDPFARGSKQGKCIIIQNDKKEEISTTVRQLNFFRWAINNGIISYIDNNIDKIYQDMNERSNRGKKKAQNYKKQHLSTKSTIGMYKTKTLETIKS